MIGNGNNINVWSDPWLKEGAWRIPLIKNIFIDLNLRVCIDHNSRGWDLSRLEDLFYRRDVAIMARKHVVSKEDFWVSDHTKSGDYTVKAGNWLANQRKHHVLIQEAEAQPSINCLTEQIWAL